MESQDRLHLGLKEQKNKFKDQEGGREGLTRCIREKSRIKWLKEENETCSKCSQINQMAEKWDKITRSTAGGDMNKPADSCKTRRTIKFSVEENEKLAVKYQTSELKANLLRN